MYRSFTERVLGGVCGGLAEVLRLNPWWLRVALILLTLISLGFGAVVYVVLWWLLPQRLPTSRQRPNIIGFLLALLFIVGMTGLWFGRDAAWLQSPTGQPLFMPVALLILSGAYLLRQIRAA